MLELRSYVGGRWVAGTGAAANAGESDHRRAARPREQRRRRSQVGARPRPLHRRAGAARDELRRARCALKAIADAIQAERDALLELAIANGGNTRSDAKFDVDGAIATLLAYADLRKSLARRSSSSTATACSSAAQRASTASTSWLPRHGVAVHINAFNFPAWGFAEKAAVRAARRHAGAQQARHQLGAGRASHHGARRREEAPARRRALVPRRRRAAIWSRTSARRTCSPSPARATPGRKLRSARNVIEHAVRVNVEADSLNAAVLGPDVEPRSDMYELFLKDVVRDMTQKAGQKCTAIRRVLVPQESSIVVNRISPSCSTRSASATRRSRTRAWARSRAARSSPTCAKACSAWAAGTPSAAPRRSATRVSSSRRSWSRKPSDAVHEREVFGPVASLLRYKDNPARSWRAATAAWCPPCTPTTRSSSSAWWPARAVPRAPVPRPSEDRAVARPRHRAAAARARRPGARRRRRGARRPARPRLLHAARRARGLAAGDRRRSG